MNEEPMFDVGDCVAKLRGDYSFEGAVVAVFNKLSGARRYVVENRDGVLHIFSGSNLGLMPEPARASDEGAPGAYQVVCQPD